MDLTTLELIEKRIENAIGDCQQVQDAWESGDLAGAVRGLDCTKESLSDVLSELRKEHDAGNLSVAGHRRR